MAARRPEPSGDVRIVTGIQAGHGPDGAVPVRRELDEWWFSKDAADEKQHTLFVYALKAFQDRGRDPAHNDDRSYSNIAGIHGLPVRPWPRDAEKSGFYCAHGRVTFPTWHTPYMLLYEQRLYEEMITAIPKEFNEKDWADWYAAADTWRLPFWDWAMKKPNWNPADQADPQNTNVGQGQNVPFIITQPEVKVMTRDGTTVPVPNPMFQYGLKPGHNFKMVGVFDDPDAPDHDKTSLRPWIGDCRVTSRWPTTREADHKDYRNVYIDGNNQDWTRITQQLQGSVFGNTEQPKEEQLYFANTLPEAVYRLFRSDANGNPVMSYEHFATQEFTKGDHPTAYPSLESVHNNMHDFAGGAGYMGDPATAGFDPVFWMHHCNTDRLLAIYQDLFEPAVNKWLSAPPQAKGNVAYADRADTPDTELLPFLDCEGKPYTSRTASFSHRKYGYTYPELQRWKYKTDKEYFDSIAAQIERLYAATPKASLVLPQNTTVAKEVMGQMTATNLKVENFPQLLMTPEYCQESVLQAVAEDPNVLDAIAALTDLNNELAASTKEPEAAQLEATELGNAAKFAAGDVDLQWSNPDYVVNVIYERFALKGHAFAVTFFLGEVPEEREEGTDFNFCTDHTAIGRVYNFSSPAEAIGEGLIGCKNCKQQMKDRKLSTGQVILTDYLIERLNMGDAHGHEPLRSMEKAEVLAWLKEHFHWRVTDHENKILEKNDPRMDLLDISIATATATHYFDATKPSVYTPYEPLMQVKSQQV